MKKAQLIKHWKVLEAWKSGKDIQYKTQNEQWVDVSGGDPTFSEHAEYRIKPSNVLKPFTYEDVETLIGKVIIFRESTCATMIISVYSRGIKTVTADHSFEYLKLNYTFLDGAPCGKYVEE